MFSSFEKMVSINCREAQFVDDTIKLHNSLEENMTISTISRFSENILIYRSQFGYMFAKQVYEIKKNKDKTITNVIYQILRKGLKILAILVFLGYVGIDTAGIGEALERSAASLTAANTSLEIISRDLAASYTETAPSDS